VGLALQLGLGGRRDAAGQLAAAHFSMLARDPIPAVRPLYNCADP
jgi:hypothetical protein